MLGESGPDGRHTLVYDLGVSIRQHLHLGVINIHAGLEGTVEYVGGVAIIVVGEVPLLLQMQDQPEHSGQPARHVGVVAGVVQHLFSRQTAHVLGVELLEQVTILFLLIGKPL